MRGAFPHHLLPDIPYHLSQSLGEEIMVSFSGTTDSSKVRINKDRIHRIMPSQGDEQGPDKSKLAILKAWH